MPSNRSIPSPTSSFSSTSTVGSTVDETTTMVSSPLVMAIKAAMKRSEAENVAPEDISIDFPRHILTPWERETMFEVEIFIRPSVESLLRPLWETRGDAECIVKLIEQLMSFIAASSAHRTTHDEQEIYRFFRVWYDGPYWRIFSISGLVPRKDFSPYATVGLNPMTSETRMKTIKTILESRKEATDARETDQTPLLKDATPTPKAILTMFDTCLQLIKQVYDDKYSPDWLTKHSKTLRLLKFGASVSSVLSS